MATEENTNVWVDCSRDLKVHWDQVTNEAWATTTTSDTVLWSGTASSTQDAINQYEATQ